MTTSPADTDRRRRPHRREQILRAAVELFHARGFQATSMEDIGAAVGMSGPSLYRHFGSKLEILEACVAPTWVSFDESLDALRRRSLAPLERLDAMIETYTDALLADPMLTAVWVQERASLRDEARKHAERVDRAVFAEWLDILVRARPELDRATARLLLRGAMQLCFAMCTARTALSRERVAAATIDAMRAVLEPHAVLPG